MNLKAENERLLGDIERLKQKLREEITRTQAGVRLDLNLEKVRSDVAPRGIELMCVLRGTGSDSGRDERARGQAHRGRYADRERDWATSYFVSCSMLGFWKACTDCSS